MGKASTRKKWKCAGFVIQRESFMNILSRERGQLTAAQVVVAENSLGILLWSSQESTR